MTRLLALLMLAGCATAEGNCRTAHAVYYAMVAGGSPAGALEMARQDVAEVCGAP